MVAQINKTKKLSNIEDKETIILKMQDEGYTRRQIADELYSGNAKSRINCLRKYMTKRGYIINDDKYVKPEESIYKKFEEVIEIKEIELNKNIVKGNNNTGKKIIGTDNKGKYAEEFSKEEIQQLKKLLNHKDEILSLIKDNSLDKNKTVEIIRVFEGDLKVKSIKVYKDILDKFDEFVENNKGYKQQDILTTAIVEYLEKRNAK